MIKISLFLRLTAKFLGCFTANGLSHCNSPIPHPIDKGKEPPVTLQWSGIFLFICVNMSVVFHAHQYLNRMLVFSIGI